MHDVASFERLGLPSVALITDQFLNQATYQATKLGIERTARVAIQHPVVDPAVALTTKAEAVFEQVVRALVSDDVPIAAAALSAGGKPLADVTEPECDT
jgi:hypothetical protein